jgi:hypothetical protein
MKNTATVGICAALALASLPAFAQEPATVTGRVTNAQGEPEAAVLVRIESLDAGATTDANGNYRLVIPGARIRAGQQLRVSASRSGLVMRAWSAGDATCESLAFDVEMVPAASGRSASSSRIRIRGVSSLSWALPTDVFRLCAAIRNEGAVLRRADLRGSGDRDLLTALGETTGSQSSVRTSGGYATVPSILLRGPRSINSSGAAAVYVNGVLAGDASALTRIRATEVDSVLIHPGHRPVPGKPAASGGIIQVMQSPRASGDGTRAYSFYLSGDREDESGLADRYVAEARRRNDGSVVADSSYLRRVEGYQYPNYLRLLQRDVYQYLPGFRTWTLGREVNFLWDRPLAGSGQGRAATSRLPIRPWVGTLPAGQRVNVNSCSGGWCQLAWDGGSGWVWAPWAVDRGTGTASSPRPQNGEPARQSQPPIRP